MSDLVPNDARRRGLESATSAYQVNLKLAAEYLTERGLTPATAQAFRLGVVLEPHVGHEMYAGRLSIPYLTRSGVVSMKFRCLKDHNCKELHCPKYLSDGQPRLFNPAALAKASGVMCITEGEVDAITLTSINVACVGYPGTQSIKPFWSRAFAGFQQILIIADGDEPGRRSADKLAAMLDTSQVVHLPDGEDVNSLVCAEGADSMRKRLGL